MSKVVKVTGDSGVKVGRHIPDITDEQREKRLCDLALRAVEKRIENGTATSAELLHFLKIATERNKYEQQEMQYRTELLRAKTDAIADARKSTTDYNRVMEAYTRYGATFRSAEDEDEEI